MNTIQTTIYTLKHDGVIVWQGTDMYGPYRYIHNMHPYSLSHAVRHEGYSVEEEVTTEE